MVWPCSKCFFRQRSRQKILSMLSPEVLTDTLRFLPRRALCTIQLASQRLDVLISSMQSPFHVVRQLSFYHSVPHFSPTKRETSLVSRFFVRLTQFNKPLRGRFSYAVDKMPDETDRKITPAPWEEGARNSLEFRITVSSVVNRSQQRYSGNPRQFAASELCARSIPPYVRVTSCFFNTCIPASFSDELFAWLASSRAALAETELWVDLAQPFAPRLLNEIFTSPSSVDAHASDAEQTTGWNAALSTPTMRQLPPPTLHVNLSEYSHRMDVPALFTWLHGSDEEQLRQKNHGEEDASHLVLHVNTFDRLIDVERLIEQVKKAFLERVQSSEKAHSSKTPIHFQDPPYFTLDIEAGPYVKQRIEEFELEGKGHRLALKLVAEKNTSKMYRIRRSFRPTEESADCDSIISADPPIPSFRTCKYLRIY